MRQAVVLMWAMLALCALGARAGGVPEAEKEAEVYSEGDDNNAEDEEYEGDENDRQPRSYLRKAKYISHPVQNDFYDDNDGYEVDDDGYVDDNEHYVDDDDYDLELEDYGAYRGRRSVYYPDNYNVVETYPVAQPYFHNVGRANKRLLRYSKGYRAKVFRRGVFDKYAFPLRFKKAHYNPYRIVSRVGKFGGYY